jgi:hypothetical protein
MSRIKYVERNVPDDVRVIVQYTRNERRQVVGATCWLRSKADDSLLAIGKARCAKWDEPNRKVARAVAVGRAVKKLMLLRNPQRGWGL